MIEFIWEVIKIILISGFILLMIFVFFLPISKDIKKWFKN